MRVSRRNFIATGAVMGAVMATRPAEAADLPAAPRADCARMQPPRAGDTAYRAVVTLNGWTLPGRRDGAWKEFHLVAEPVAREMAPGLVAHLWGYNGQSPGPTIECVEGDKLRIFVTNKLGEPTTMHWQGLAVPNGMAGLGGVTQPPIAPGETYAYAFEMKRSGTFLYGPHADVRAQAAMGLAGAIVAHPRAAGGGRAQRDRTPCGADRDYLMLVNAHALAPVRGRPPMPTPLWSCNSRIFPGIDALVAGTGERVRVRVANLAPIGLALQLHGHALTVTATGGGSVPDSARWSDSAIDLPAGAVRVVEFTAETAGDWALHCPLPRAIKADGVDDAPARRAAAETSSAAARRAGDPPAAAGFGPFGPIAMGPLFTLVKVRDELAADDYRDPGWFHAAPDLRAGAVAGAGRAPASRRAATVAARQLEVKVVKPGSRA